MPPLELPAVLPPSYPQKGWHVLARLRGSAEYHEAVVKRARSDGETFALYYPQGARLHSEKRVARADILCASDFPVGAAVVHRGREEELGFGVVVASVFSEANGLLVPGSSRRGSAASARASARQMGSARSGTGGEEDDGAGRV